MNFQEYFAILTRYRIVTDGRMDGQFAIENIELMYSIARVKTCVLADRT